MREDFISESHSSKIKFDKLAAVESRGFVFASALSYNLSKPLILFRKKGKLPADVHSQDFQLEYGKATIEVHKDSIEKDTNEREEMSKTTVHKLSQIILKL